MAGWCAACKTVWRLVQDAELKVRPGDLDDPVLIALNHRHTTVAVTARPADRLELHVHLEVGAVAAHEGPPQGRGQPAFCREYQEQLLARHPGLDRLHALEPLGHPG